MNLEKTETIAIEEFEKGIEGQPKVPLILTSDKTIFCRGCGGILFRYRISKQNKSSIFLKIKLCCSKDEEFASVEIAFPIG